MVTKYPLTKFEDELITPEQLYATKVILDLCINRKRDMHFFYENPRVEMSKKKVE